MLEHLGLTKEDKVRAVQFDEVDKTTNVGMEALNIPTKTCK